MGETIQQKSMNSGAEENPAQKRREIRLLLASGVLFALSLLFQLLARLVPGFGEWYAVTVYPFIVGTLGRISGIFPFSVVESAVYFLIAAAVWYTVTHIRRIKRVLVRALFLLTGIFFLFTFNCGVNYYRKPFSSYSGLEVRKSSKDELTELCAALTKTVNQYCEDGVGAAMEMKAANREGVAAMRRLGERIPSLQATIPGRSRWRGRISFRFSSCAASIHPSPWRRITTGRCRITTFPIRSAMSCPICGGL